MIRLARTNRSLMAEWWWTVDKWTLLLLVCLMIVGGVLALAASPAVAMRIHLPPFHFVYKQLAFFVPAIGVLIGVSLLNVRQVRRAAALVFAVAFVLMALTPVLGPEVKGAHRWLQLGPVGIQPSEFVKPAFIVLVAWLFAEAQRTPGIPGTALAVGLYGMVVAVLAVQPDFGQLMLVTLVFGAMFFMAGLSWGWIGSLAAIALAGAVTAYSMMPHVASRVDRFLDPESGDTYQIDRALDAVNAGGLFGRGPGEGVVKRILPDAHTDFIFAVAAEEYGVIAGLIIIGLFATIVMRTLRHAMEEQDLFVQFAACGLVALFGLQALINMSVNVNLMPAKGMTLPFISYGGSSLLALAFAMGMLLALTRRRAGSNVTAANGRRINA
ncbi:putative lipid II flippase FtsW [Parvibaculum sp.]|jgi:cell division protein FtsW|uniref:putative lipid II flippase FtsW n=1 Tax=Parvibaculum sp. TaxID=2024848 RepID=UPI001B21D1E2|nr:putative lipid II flippase FtsW [Parvibaculum sp.]MBO6633278.1 putative lipid II flippase FtsW [Parvibaculum sp.]MBO6679741.1 putative lipid II flippase FtsW [Parvibaculum sp.]MBO6683598.1 putative lipid II flippase FtsW [Parvibaculum sp.]MBO6905861.1 putative lipid II flippase FtsW [Parvibaculum sp.]